MSDRLVHSTTALGTVITIEVIGHGETPMQRAERHDAVQRALDWFQEIHRRCSRFDPASELRGLTTRVGEAVSVSALLFEAIRFAISVAEASGGAFDPTVGHRMERRGFDRDERTGQRRVTALDAGPEPTWRDVIVDPASRTVALQAPMVLDLGGVAKGLAIDLAARELEAFGNFAIDAGGDLHLHGRNSAGELWSVGIRHPREPGTILATVRVSDRAVCTSGDYERPRTDGGHGHHLLDPRTGESADGLASVTVVAESAMVADALATAAFVLGPAEGLRFLEAQGVDGLLVTPDLSLSRTTGFPHA